MKTLRYIGIALLAVILCANFVACSDDENEPEMTSTTLADTTWKIVSVTPNDELGLEGLTITFNANLTVTFNPYFEDPFTHYILNGNILVLNYGLDDDSDDYIEGVLTINGNSATYKIKGYGITVNLQKQ